MFLSWRTQLGLLMVLTSLAMVFVGRGEAIPVGDAYQRLYKGSVDEELGAQPMNDTAPPVDRSIRPTLTPGINEPHPIPDYIKKFPGGGPFPRYYLELLEVSPVHQVQSKIFNKQAFRKTRRIGVAGFENKTEAPFKDETAGEIVANQISRELQKNNNYVVIPPSKFREDARLKIMTTPSKPLGKEKRPPKSKTGNHVPGLPYSGEKVDAVMIGAVTKYMDSYIDNRGRIKKSLSSGVEFGAYLVNTQTGEVIWGARFVGTQSPNLVGFLSGETTHWLNKEELSKAAMKYVLKAFYATRNSVR
ncbi:MAG: hypothetical protein ACE5E9_01675 [Nitrospinaceae bacterium]